MVFVDSSHASALLVNQQVKSIVLEVHLPAGVFGLVALFECDMEAFDGQCSQESDRVVCILSRLVT